MYDVIFIDAQGEETPRRAAPARPHGRRDARASTAAAERGAGRMVLPGSSRGRANCVCVVPVPLPEAA